MRTGTIESFGEDGYDRVIFVLPSDQREELPKIYQKESAMVLAYTSEHFYHRK